MTESASSGSGRGTTRRQRTEHAGEAFAPAPGSLGAARVAEQAQALADEVRLNIGFLAGRAGEHDDVDAFERLARKALAGLLSVVATLQQRAETAEKARNHLSERESIERESIARDAKRRAEARVATLQQERDEAYDKGYDDGVERVNGEAVCSVCGWNHDRDESAACEGCEAIRFDQIPAVLVAVREDVTRLREALAFYADKASYVESTDPHATRFASGVVPIEDDYGRRARAALAAREACGTSACPCGDVTRCGTVDPDCLSVCPKCGGLVADMDGFGVLYHPDCGYCAHASVTGDVCEFCAALVVSSQPGAPH